MVNEFIVSRVNLIFPGNDCRGGSEPIVSAPVLIPTHSGFDGLSERAAFAPVSRAETAAAARSRLGSTPPTCTVQQVGSFLRYTGRAANAAAKTADDPKPPSAHEGPQMLDERARLRGTPAMGRHEGVDRQRRTAPSGKRLDERAAPEIVADQQFGREADP